MFAVMRADSLQLTPIPLNNYLPSSILMVSLKIEARGHAKLIHNPVSVLSTTCFNIWDNDFLR
jgi:hypothetical protein